MSTKVSRVGMICAEPAISASVVEPRIGHADIADIGLDGAERIIRRLRRRRLRQRVEERRLADIRQADDAAFEAHGWSGPIIEFVGLPCRREWPKRQEAVRAKAIFNGISTTSIRGEPFLCRAL